MDAQRRVAGRRPARSEAQSCESRHRAEEVEKSGLSLRQMSDLADESSFQHLCLTSTLFDGLMLARWTPRPAHAMKQA